MKRITIALLAASFATGCAGLRGTAASVTDAVQLRGDGKVIKVDGRRVPQEEESESNLTHSEAKNK